MRTRRTSTLRKLKATGYVASPTDRSDHERKVEGTPISFDGLRKGTTTVRGTDVTMDREVVEAFTVSRYGR